jgi:hypothetical protein
VGEPCIGDDEPRRRTLEQPETARRPEVLRHERGQLARVATSGSGKPLKLLA